MDDGLNVVLQTYEPALKRVVQLGKLARLADGRPAYVFDKDPSKRLRQANAWGIAPCVLDAMAARGVEVIRANVRDPRGAYTLETTREEVLRQAILRGFKGRPVANYHMPEELWRRVPHERTPFVTKVVRLPWVEHKEPPRPEPVAAQGRLL
jgi:hypothetical protein